MEETFAAFQQLARSGRVGTPVFFRCVVTGAEETAEATLASILEAAAAILGDRPRAVYARGDASAGSLHAVLDFDSGLSALAIVAPGEPACDAMLLGNHGAAYLPGTRPPTRLPGARQVGDEETGRRCDGAKRQALLFWVHGGHGERRGGHGEGRRGRGGSAVRWSLIIRRSLSEGRPVVVEEAEDG